MFQNMIRFGVFLFAGLAGAYSSSETMALENKDNEDLREAVKRLESRINKIESQKKSNTSDSALDRWTKGLEKDQDGNIYKNGNFRLMDSSLNLITSVGASNKKGAALRSLQGGGHDPKRRGFTLQQAELSFYAAVDPYFTGETHFTTTIDDEGETVFELEEAFLTTSSLPHGLEVEMGHFLTEFGRHNTQHAHSWLWMDQPIIHTRVFGSDGMRGLGARVGWNVPLSWQSEVHYSAQNAAGENMLSFLANDEVYTDRALAGRTHTEPPTNGLKDFVHLIRWENGFDINSELSGQIGFSHLMGPNATGREGETQISGVDLVIKWMPEKNNKGWPFVKFEAEYIDRQFGADADTTNNLTAKTFGDRGGYAQIFYGFVKDWAVGVRYEKVEGDSRQSVGGNEADIYRNQRERISPLVSWDISEFSKMRLQYNYDRAEHLTPNHDAHSVFLGFNISLGAHPAHKY